MFFEVSILDVFFEGAFSIFFDFESPKAPHGAPKWLKNVMEKRPTRVPTLGSGPEGVPGCHWG